MRELTEIFEDPVELMIAQGIVRVVPEEIGDYHHINAKVCGMMKNAFPRGIKLDKKGNFDSDYGPFGKPMKFINDHHLMKRLVDEGYIREKGHSGTMNLYVKAKK